MGDFQKKIKQKEVIDENLLDSSFRSIASLLGEKKGIHNQKSSSVCNIEQHLNLILSYFQIEAIKFPEYALDEKDKINHMSSFTGVFQRKIYLKKKWWKQGATPLLCQRKDGEFVAIIPSLQGGYQYYDAKIRGLKKLTKKEAREYERIAISFYKPFKNESMGTKDIIKFLAHSFTIGDIIWLIGVSFLLGILGLVIPKVNHTIFHSLIPAGKVGDIWGIATVLVGVNIIMVLFSFVRTIWIVRIGNKMEISIQGAVWSRIFLLPTGFFKKFEAGELTNRALAAERICVVLKSSVFPIILSFIFSFIYLFQIFQFSKDLFFPSLCIVFLLLINAVVNGYIQLKFIQTRDVMEGKLSSLTFQLLSGISKIRIAGAEIRAFSKWADLYQKKPIIPNPILQIAPAINKCIMLAGTILLYAIAYEKGVASSDYIAFHLAFGSFVLAILQFASITGQLAILKPSLDLLHPIIKAKPEVDEMKIKVKELKGKIQINQISFRYQEDMPIVLNELSLDIEPGEYVALVGPSGCGKSTILRLLLGFEKPETGAIYYDLHDLENLDVRSVRQRIGVVLQNGKVFSGDIYSNIVVCAPWLSVEEAWEIAEKVGLAEDIRKMPMGMFTMLSEDGLGISGGQKQRLLIARALASKPDVLIFDEATSALDNVTQATIVETLEQMKCTRIIIAHRLSTIKKCSKIVYLEKGKIVEMGTYEELMQQDGAFMELAGRQLV